MNKFSLPWEQEPISTIVELFNCTVQHVEPIEEVNNGDNTLEGDVE